MTRQTTQAGTYVADPVHSSIELELVKEGE